MAGKAGEAYIEVVPDTKQFGSTLSKQVTPELNKSAASLGKSMTSAGKSMTLGLTVPIVGFGVAAVSAFNESNAAAAQTAAVLKSTGGVANVTAKHVDTLTASLSEKSATDDDVIRSGVNMLLTFKDIRNEAGKGNDIFDQTSSILVDMSRAMGVDAKSQAIQLGKALNDPVKGVTALTRVGVTFNDEQKKTIARLVETGDTIGAQQIILKELRSEFGGSAKEFAKSSAGMAEAAKVKLGNAMEGLGKTVSETLLPALAAVVGWLSKAFDWFNNLPGPIKSGVVIVLALVAAIGPLLIVMGSVVSGLAAIATAAGITVGALLPIIGVVIAVVAVVAILAYVIIHNWQTIKRVTFAVWNAVLGFLKKWWPLLLVIITGGVGLVVVLIVKNWDKIKATTLAVWNAIRNAVGGAIEWVWDKIKTVLGWIEKAWSSTWEGLQSGVEGIWNGIVAAVKAGANLVLAAIESAVNAFLQPFQTLSTAPVIGAKIPDVPEVSIPRLAQGAIVRRATLSVIGERGPEAVIPLRHLASGFGLGARTISGTLTLTPESDAYVRGIVVGEDEANARHARTLGRMRGRSSG